MGFYGAKSLKEHDALKISALGTDIKMKDSTF